ncbi:MAG: hypothetical protein ACXABY_22575, partial [Candidatus Thorarchaeota archaeon]
MRALCRLREHPHYRRDSFVAGLRRCGFSVECTPHWSNPVEFSPKVDDVLVIWNIYGYNQQLIKNFYYVGAKVLVVENGYMGKDREGRQYYAIARDGHNGSGKWFVGNTDRFSLLGLEPQPWRKGGNYIVVRGQRGIGSSPMKSPPNWHADCIRRLSQYTHREIKFRAHPGNNDKEVGLDKALENCHSLVTWASSEAGRALLRGIPAFYEAPNHVCELAMKRGIEEVEYPLRNNIAREKAFHQMSWAQWSVDEISSGEPFKL